VAATAGSAALVALVADEGSFQPWDDDVVSADPLGFVDTVAYPERLARARADAGTTEAVVTGRVTCRGHDVVIVAGVFAFLAGSQGVAAGERVTRAFERAGELSLPVVGMPCSAGTRMQEGTLAFVQMAKIAAAVARFRAGGGCYVSYLRDPTLGGVLSSWGALGAVTWAEPAALVGLTGPRVVELLTGEPFPDGVMVAEHLHAHGVVDDVVAPEQLAERVARVLAVAVAPPDPAPAVVDDDVAVAVAVEEPSAWSCVEATRAPHRPGVRDLLARWASDVTLLTGDGAGGDDMGCLVALCRFAGIPAVMVGADRLARHRGASLGAQDYRKARRGMKLAGELGLPLVTVIDMQGAQATARSEEGGLAREIGRCLMALSRLPVPTVSVLLGEGSGGGAIALLPADRILAAQDAWLAPIAPEGAAAILFRTTDEAPRLAAMQAITASELQRHGIVDRVVAGSDAAHLAERVGAAVAAELGRLAGRDVAELLASRQSRLRRIGDAPGARG